MPELPEVETIRLSLSKKIIGLTISNIEIRNQKTFQGDSSLVLNQMITNVWRRAKALGIDFGNGYTLLFHLKMSGQIIFKPSTTYNLFIPRSFSEGGKPTTFIGGHPTQDMTGEMPNRSTRVIFELNNQDTSSKIQTSSLLFFNDQRKFGWVKVVNSEQLAVDRFLEKLGPEPLEKQFTWEVLKTNLLRHKGQAVKVSLLDQHVVAGVGNIYACEACFNAGIDPRKKVGELKDEEFKKLHHGVVQALKDGVKYGGSTKTHFVDTDGRKGLFLDHAKVYGKDKKPCLICRTDIKKVKLGGRGTFFCPKCQQ